ncbi:MAG: SDR family NAD(P)-dependent oxidoreductase [Bacteroidales bacterium]|nr:SDR family NAD(P)-dependent oxidoreductase [Bacteroidales bacterium]
MIVLITGVSSGFGRATARKLASEGHTVYGTCRRDVEPIPGVTYIKAEVTSDEDCRAAVQQVLDEQGRIDVFINNAGMGIGGPLEFSSIEQARRQMDVNWLGMVRFLHYVLPAMRSQKSGKIICISSIGGLMGLPFQGLYSASKFAIEGYCEALRLEVRQHGIKVVVVEPGDFATSFTASRDSVSDAAAHEAYPAYARSLKSIEHDETSGLKPEVLAARISKIVRCRNPRQSYIVSTLEQRLSVFLKAILPGKWFSAILASYYKL